MAGRNFFDKLERDIDLQKEYKKIESLVLNANNNSDFSLENVIEFNFKDWKYNANFLDFIGLREQLGFTFEQDRYELVSSGHIENVYDFFDYCEMIVNMTKNLSAYDYVGHRVTIREIERIMKFDLNALNHEIRKYGDKYIIVQKDAAVAEVVEIVEENLAETILEYNHYVLKGNLERKKEILIKIASILEPKRSEIDMLNSQLSSDYFYMVNTMNIRHNNCDSSDNKKYNVYFTNASVEEKEEIYDDIYQMGLLIFLLLENKKRSSKIKEIKEMRKLIE